MIEKLVKKYRLFLMLGIALVLISFVLGVVRTLNEATLTMLVLAGDSISEAFRSAWVIEELLKRYSEIVPLFGLGLLKLGIGFAITTIVVSLKATGETAGFSLAKANVKPPEMQPPLFARIFTKMLIAGILIELVAVIVSIGWMITGLGVIDLTMAGQDVTAIAALDHALEVLAEPLEGLGVALLIGGIAFGLATIAINLGRQSTLMPRALAALTGKESDVSPLEKIISKPLLLLTILGGLITASGLIPFAFIRLAFDIPIVNAMWETWMFVGIATMLFAIGFWLLLIIQRLRDQRVNLGKTVKTVAGVDMGDIEPTLGITKIVPAFLVIGFLWIWGFLVLSFLTMPDQALAVFKPLVRPGKAISLAIIFIGIGLALMTIVINLRLTSFMLPGAFSRLVAAIKGDQPQPAPTSMSMKPMTLAPKKLFVGILLGALIVILGTFPLAIWRNLVSPAFGNDMAIFLMLEHIIGPWNGLGVGLIFFFIGMFFSSIVTFVSARRQIISEGVESCVVYALKKD